MALFDFDVVKRAIGDVGAQLKKLRQEREDAMRAREDLQSLPLAKADFQALLEAWIDRQGAGFVERLQTGAAYYLRNPMAALPENVKAPVHPMAVLTACRNPQDMATVAGLEANLFVRSGGRPSNRVSRLSSMKWTSPTRVRRAPSGWQRLRPSTRKLSSSTGKSKSFSKRPKRQG